MKLPALKTTVTLEIIAKMMIMKTAMIMKMLMSEDTDSDDADDNSADDGRCRTDDGRCQWRKMPITKDADDRRC